MFFIPLPSSSYRPPDKAEGRSLTARDGRRDKSGEGASSREGRGSVRFVFGNFASSARPWGGPAIPGLAPSQGCTSTKVADPFLGSFGKLERWLRDTRSQLTQAHQWQQTPRPMNSDATPFRANTLRWQQRRTARAPHNRDRSDEGCRP